MHRTFLAAVLLVASLFGVVDRAGGAEPAPDGDFDMSCPGGNSDAHFFPNGVFAKDRPDLDQFVRCWYSWQLGAMEEPSLSHSTATYEVSYRFLWLRTFHPPIAVRISLSGNQLQLTAVELSGAGGYEPGVIVRRTSVTLTPHDWGRIESALNADQFWSAPTTTERMGFDGASWIIEGRKQDDYHVVTRWSPEPEDEFHKLGLLFLELAGWSGSVEPVY